MSPAWHEPEPEPLRLTIREPERQRLALRHSPHPTIRGWRADSHRRSIERVIEAMVLHPSERWEIDEMARIAQFSKFHFTRLFSHYTGMPPHRWLLHYRIELAKELLTRMSYRTVTDVMTVLGYSSVGTFSSRFSMTVGCSPTQYRRWARYAEQLTERAGGVPKLDREAERRGVCLAPRDVPAFAESVTDLERQLTARPASGYAWGERIINQGLLTDHPK